VRFPPTYEDIGVEAVRPYATNPANRAGADRSPVVHLRWSFRTCRRHMFPASGGASMPAPPGPSLLRSVAQGFATKKLLSVCEGQA